MTINAATIRVVVMTTAMAAAPAFAQQPPAKDAPPASAATAAEKKTDLPAPPANFEYAPQGRRDPFISLVARGDDGKGNNGEATKKRAEGVPGMLTGEMSVRGI